MLMSTRVRYVVALLAAVGVGCGSVPDGDAGAGSGSSTTVDVDPSAAGDDASIDDLPWQPLPDLPTLDQSCEDRGTEFGVVFGPVDVETPIASATISEVGLTAGPSGLFASYARYNPETALTDYVGVRIRTDGAANGSPWSLAVVSASPVPYPSDERVVLTHCVNEKVGWRAFDASGSTLGPTHDLPQHPGCSGAAPAVGWTNNGLLATWQTTPAEQCPDGCVVVAFGNENVVFGVEVLHPTFIVTDPLAIAVADKAALVVASHVTFESTNELAMSLVDHGGRPLFPVLREPFDGFGEQPQAQAPVAVAANAKQGYVVVVGGRGSAYGRVVLDSVASVVSEFEDVPFPAELADTVAFDSDVRIARRTGGFVVYGPASRTTSNSVDDGTLMLMLGDDGALMSQEFFVGSTSSAVFTYDERTWVVFGGSSLSLVELGCVF